MIIFDLPGDRRRGRAQGESRSETRGRGDRGVSCGFAGDQDDHDDDDGGHGDGTCDDHDDDDRGGICDDHDDDGGGGTCDDHDDEDGGGTCDDHDDHETRSGGDRRVSRCSSGLCHVRKMKMRNRCR